VIPGFLLFGSQGESRCLEWLDGPQGRALTGHLEGDIAFHGPSRGFTLRLFGGVDGVSSYSDPLPGLGLGLGYAF
jgi:hypothetical protein